MYNKIFVIGVVLAATLIAGLFATTPMAAYADDGDYSGTETEQKNKQNAAASGWADVHNCTGNDIESADVTTTDRSLAGGGAIAPVCSDVS